MRAASIFSFTSQQGRDEYTAAALSLHVHVLHFSPVYNQVRLMLFSKSNTTEANAPDSQFVCLMSERWTFAKSSLRVCVNRRRPVSPSPVSLWILSAPGCCCANVSLRQLIHQRFTLIHPTLVFWKLSFICDAWIFFTLLTSKVKHTKEKKNGCLTLNSDDSLNVVIWNVAKMLTRFRCWGVQKRH